MKRTGIVLTPFTKSEWSRFGGAGQLEVGEALDDLAHGGLDLGPGQAGAEAEVLAAPAEGHVLVGRARHVEHVRVLEHLLVAVGGGVVHDDLVALLDRHAADLGVARGGATEVVDRRAPAEHLLHARCPTATGRRGGARAWSGWSSRASIEWLMRFRVVSFPATISVMKKRLSSASLSRSPSISAFTSSVMMSSRGFGATVGRDLVAHHVHLHRRGVRAAVDLLVVGVVPAADEVVRQRDHPRPHLGLEADHLADDLHGHLGGDLLDELRLALLAHVVDDLGGAPLDVLDELRDHPRREALRHQPPVAEVLGRVHHEDREAEAGQRLLVGGGDERAAQLRAEGGAVVAHRLHVVVLGERPEAGVVHLGVEVHRRLVAQPVELVVRHAPPPGGGEQVDPVEGRGHRHRCGLLVQARDADGASEGGDRGAVVDGGRVDAAHHLEAEQHADHRGAGGARRRRATLVARSTRRPRRRRSPMPPRSGGRGARVPARRGRRRTRARARAGSSGRRRRAGG